MYQKMRWWNNLIITQTHLHQDISHKEQKHWIEFKVGLLWVKNKLNKCMKHILNTPKRICKLHKNIHSQNQEAMMVKTMNEHDIYFYNAFMQDQKVPFFYYLYKQLCANKFHCKYNYYIILAHIERKGSVFYQFYCFVPGKKAPLIFITRSSLISLNVS